MQTYNSGLLWLEDTSGVGGPKPHLIPQIQLDNYQIVQNTPEMDLNSGRRNSPDKGKEEVTLNS